MYAARRSCTVTELLCKPCTNTPSWHVPKAASVPKAAPARRAVIANELKYKAPHAHTMLELVYVRWGRAAHIVYFFFAVLTNLLVSLSMLQGAAPSPCMTPQHSVLTHTA